MKTCKKTATKMEMLSWVAILGSSLASGGAPAARETVAAARTAVAATKADMVAGLPREGRPGFIGTEMTH
jgi:hypothetical protein